MAKASDNPFPSVLVVPGAAPASPAAGQQRLYLDSADGNKLKRKDSSGAVVTVEGGGSAIGVRVNRTVGVTLPSSTNTVIPWTAEVFDTHGFHDNATNNSRLTIPTGQGGVYVISAMSELYNANTAGERTLAVRLNGGAGGYLAIDTRQDGVAIQRPVCVTMARLEAGDYVEVIANQTGAGDGVFRHAYSDLDSEGYITFSLAKIGS